MNVNLLFRISLSHTSVYDLTQCTYAELNRIGDASETSICSYLSWLDTWNAIHTCSNGWRFSKSKIIWASRLKAWQFLPKIMDQQKDRCKTDSSIVNVREYWRMLAFMFLHIIICWVWNFHWYDQFNSLFHDCCYWSQDYFFETKVTS